MAFDPSQPFDIVSEPKDKPQDRPAFDPSKPFEVIGEREEDVAGKLETLSKVATDKPDEAARYKSLADKTGASYELVKTDPDTFEAHANPADWSGIATGAPSLAKHLADNPVDFQMARNDLDRLMLVKGGRSAGEWANDLGVRAVQGAALAGQALVGTADLATKLNPVTMAVDAALGREHATLSELMAKGGVSFNNASEAADGLVSDVSKAESETIAKTYGDLGIMAGAKETATTPGYIAEKVVQSAPQMLVAMAAVRQRAGQILAEGGEEALKAAMPELAKLSSMIEGAQSAGNYAGSKAEKGELDNKAALAAGGQGITTALVGAFSNKIGAKFGIDDVEAAVGSGFNYKDGVTGFLKRFMGTAVKEGPIEEGLQSATEQGWSNFGDGKDIGEGVAQAFAEGSIVGVAQGGGMMATGDAVNAVTRKLGKTSDSYSAADTHAQDILGQIKTIKEMDIVKNAPSTLHQILDAADGEEVKEVYIDPADLFNQKIITREQLEAIAPSSSSQIDEAIDKGGLIRLPVNELMVGIAANDINELDIVPHIRRSAADDGISQFQAQAKLDGLTDELTNIMRDEFAKGAESESKRKEFDDLHARIEDRMVQSGMDKGKAKQQGAMWAAQSLALAKRTGQTPEQVLEDINAKITVADVGQSGDVFNRQSIQSVKDSIAADGIDAQISESGDIINLDKIVVPEDSRNQGKGTAAMQNIADRRGHTFNLDSTENSLIEERDSFRDSPHNEWTPIQQAIYDGVTTSIVDPVNENTHSWLQTAIDNNRLDVAEVIVARAERTANAMSITPGVSKENPKYDAIKADLEQRRKDGLSGAAKLRETLENSRQVLFQPGDSGGNKNSIDTKTAQYEDSSAPDQELSDQQADDIITLYKELGSDDDVFQYDRAVFDDMDSTILSLMPEGAKQEADDLVIEMAKGFAKEKGQPAIEDVKKYIVPTNEVVVDDQGNPILRDGEKQHADYKRDAYIYINELGELWVDLSDLKRAGGVGGKIYTKAADYAASKGLVFKGDPEGLSDDALLKRTEHMASGIARRKGTASFIPHDRQVDPHSDESHKNSELNKLIRPIRWTKGSDTMNQREVVKTAYHNITTVIPELRHAWIDTDNARILYKGAPIDSKFSDWVHELQTGKQRHDGGKSGFAGSVEKQGSALRAARHVYASASIKRQLLANTIARHAGESAEARRQLLDRLGEILPNLESLDNRKAFYQNEPAPRGTYNPSTREITILRNADLSTFLHESGHLFLDVMADFASREGASEGLRKDMDAALNWFGIAGETADERMAAWKGMSLEQQRPHHEKWAESFEQYLFEGKAPSLELRDAFRNFRQWLTHVYKSLSRFVSSHDGAKLNDEVRQIFDRMLATEEQIAEAEASRSMTMMFGVKPDNVTDAEWQGLLEQAELATQTAVEQFSTRSMRDLRYASNAKNKAIRAMQREEAGLRHEVNMEARKQILSQPVYRAWQFLKAPIEGSKAANKKAKQSEGVDSKRDSLFAAIAKLGGLNREEMMAQMGYGAKDFAAWKSGIFSKPVVRKDGGLSLDAMSEALSQHNYLTVDEHGKVEIGDLLDKAMEEMRSNKQYSTDADYDVLLGDTQYAATPDAEQVDFVGGRLSRQAIREMYDDADLANMQGGSGDFSVEGYTKSETLQQLGKKDERQYVLFDETGNLAHADKKRKNAKKSSGNVDAARQIPGRFSTTVGSEVVRKIDAGFDKLDTPEKIAYATSHITKNPQEVLLVVVTDKNHKPLSVLRHAIGMKDSSAVDPGIVAGWAVNVPNGAHMWLSHNHPSGKPDLSRADLFITDKINELLNGSHIESRGIMAVTHEGRYGYSHDGNYRPNSPIPKPEKSVSADVVEREFKTTGLLSSNYMDGISDHQTGVAAAKEIGGGESGVMLLDAQYRPIGFIPVDFAQATEIRGEKLQTDLLGALELSNAVAAISYSKDTSVAAERGVLNVGGLISLAQVRPIDVLIDHGDKVISFANMGAMLNSSTFKQKGGDTSGKRSLESLGVMSDEGLHPDTVADLFGLSSGDELVRKLLTMPDPVSEIERLTDEIMLQRHSDLATPEAREQAAEAAIHNDVRAKMMATELMIMNRALGKPRMIMAAAKEYAARIVTNLKVRDLKPAQYESAETKAGTAAMREWKSGNTNEAAMQKRNQVLHNITAKMVRDAQDEVEKAVRYLKKFDKPNKKIDIDYQEQIDTLLERYDLRQKTLKTIDRSQNLAQWMEQQKAEGLEPVIPDYLQDEARRTNYKMLTVEELRGLVDAVKNIEHLGRLKNRLLTDKAKRELNALADDIGKSITDNGGEVKPSKIERNSTVDKLSDLASGFFSMHRKLASIVRQLDGWKDGGLFWETMIKPMNAAGDHEAVMHESSTMELAKVFAPLKGKKLTQKLYIPMIATSLSYEGRLAVALNWGNEGNRQRLMDGDKWGVPEVNAILATLTADDWKFVQGVWDHIATYKDAIGEQQKRLTGVEPSWVESTPFEVKTFDGQTVQVQGGYYPAKYDTTRSTQALSNEAAGNVFDQWKSAKGQGKTRDGFTKSRATQVKDRPIRKDFGVITQHITEVTHRLAWQDWVVDANRLLKKEQLDSSIRAHYGNEILEEMRKAIEDITTGDMTAQSSFEKAINHLRIGTTIVGLGYNLTTSLLQPFGLTQSMVRIGPKWVAKGLSTWIGNPARMNARTEEVYAKSDFMRLRGKTMMREMNEILNSVRKEKMSKIEASYFYGIQKMQIIADMPTWLGQYEKSMAEFDGDEGKAIALADQAVLDAQGGGQNKDLARIQRGGPLLKLWTNFYSFFNTTYNLTREVVGRTDVKDPASVAKAAVDMLLLYSIPAVMGTLLKAAVMGGGDDDDELADKMIRDQMGYLFGTMVGLREISAAFSGFNGYQGPAGTRFFSEVAKFGKQAEQGEADAPFLKSLNNVGGIIFHYPAGQINRTVEGANALMEGETDNYGALIFGKPR